MHNNLPVLAKSLPVCCVFAEIIYTFAAVETCHFRNDPISYCCEISSHLHFFPPILRDFNFMT